ncbi:Protein tar1 [Bulinus truncatus]|nr:Protein tar1 [Bulinus truncatus]
MTRAHVRLLGPCFKTGRVFFSTFPHGTCSLSDSCLYLALDGVYHPLWAAFPNNPTPETLSAAQRSTRKGLTPTLGEAPIRRTSAPARAADGVPYTTVPASVTLGDSVLGSFRFTRRYWGNPC